MRKYIYQAAAVLVALLFLSSAWLLYRGDFLSLHTEAQKVSAIVDYASDDPDDPSPLRVVLHPVVQFDETFGDRRILVFTDSEIDGLLGRMQFRRGILGGWQPLSAFYNKTPVMIQSTTIRDQNIRVVYGVDCPANVAHYKVQANLRNDATLMAEGDITTPTFFHIHETDRDFFPAMELYDGAGNHLDYSYLASDQSIPSPSIGSAETDMVYWICAAWLGIGYLIVKYLWDQRKKETA
jgi:hypothetical protein